MLARHLIDLSFFSEKATRQLCLPTFLVSLAFSWPSKTFFWSWMSVVVRGISSQRQFSSDRVGDLYLLLLYPHPLASYLKSLVFPYCAHMHCSSLATGPKFGSLPSPYLKGHLYTSTQLSPKDESFLRCTSTIPAAVVSAVPIVTLPGPICLFGFLRISSVSSRHAVQHAKVTAEVWTGDVANGFATLASNAGSSDDMPFSRLGSPALVSLLHGTSLAPPSYFKVDGENRGTGLKEQPGRELRSRVRKSSTLRLLPTPNGPCGSNGG